jgi:superfamily II DNA or RNA helicase
VTVSGNTVEERLDELELPPVIETSETDFIQDFYNPILSRAIEYKRGVGYFTSGWLKNAARGIAGLASNGGKAKWIISPILEEDDWEAFKMGEEGRRNEVIYESLERGMEELEEGLEEDTLNTVAWMIADGLLEIKFAVPDGRNIYGDFHDKWGIVTGIYGGKMAFHGSQNDSQKGFYNYESYDVFCDWACERDAERIRKHEERFDDLWNDEKEDISVYSLPEGVSEDIAQLRETDDAPYDKDRSSGRPMSARDNNITLRDYQQEAVNQWQYNGRHGLFEMATGTGKTYTAIGAMDQTFAKQEHPMVVVIAVPNTHLAFQWRDDLEDWGYDEEVYMIFGSVNTNWKSDMGRVLDDIRIEMQDIAILLTTHDTLSDEHFRSEIQQLNCDRLLIADEVHGSGSEERKKGLLKDYNYRIGLSATPQRYFDEEGTDFLIDYFNGVVYELPLGEAIPEHLTPYEYKPYFVEMTPEELHEYEEISSDLGWMAASDDVEDKVVENMMMERADLIKKADNKYSKLHDILEGIDEPDHLLVYTNDEQIDQAQQILDEHGIFHHKFTQAEKPSERPELLKQFDKGNYDALVAMKCLDEGVDVPSTREAILMSSTGNPKQFIQRRGRVLRHYEGKEKAVIHDIIVVPSLSDDLNPDIKEIEKKILLKELDRFDEFASNADNEIEARNAIETVRTIYEV